MWNGVFYFMTLPLIFFYDHAFHDLFLMTPKKRLLRPRPSLPPPSYELGKDTHQS